MISKESVGAALELAFETDRLRDRIANIQEQADNIGRLKNSGVGTYDDAHVRTDELRDERLHLQSSFEAIQSSVGALIGREIEGSSDLFAP